MRRFLGVVLVIGGVFILLGGYASVPSRSACSAINSVQGQLGQAPVCSSTPSAGYFIVSGALALAGLLCLAPWIIRWLRGR